MAHLDAPNAEQPPSPFNPLNPFAALMLRCFSHSEVWRALTPPLSFVLGSGNSCYFLFKKIGGKAFIGPQGKCGVGACSVVERPGRTWMAHLDAPKAEHPPSPFTPAAADRNTICHHWYFRLVDFCITHLQARQQ